MKALLIVFVLATAAMPAFSVEVLTSACETQTPNGTKGFTVGPNGEILAPTGVVK